MSVDCTMVLDTGFDHVAETVAAATEEVVVESLLAVPLH